MRWRGMSRRERGGNRVREAEGGVWRSHRGLDFTPGGTLRLGGFGVKGGALTTRSRDCMTCDPRAAGLSSLLGPRVHSQRFTGSG